MASRNKTELAAGAVVLLVAAGFLVYAVVNTGHAEAGGGDVLHATFNSVDGLSSGSDVRLAGVKIGSVTAMSIDHKTFQADVTLSVPSDVHLPTDTSAQITSDGLLGGNYLSLVPGGANEVIPNGGAITITQSAASLQDLLGKFIFSVSDLASNVQKQLKQNAPAPDAASPAAPASGGGLTGTPLK